MRSQDAEEGPARRLFKNAQIQGDRQSLSASGGQRSETYSPVRRNEEG